LNSADPATRKASAQRLLQAARITAMCGGYSTCVHAAYYQKDSHQLVSQRVKEHLKDILKMLHDEGHEVWVRPETGGKINQFADSYDLIAFSAEVEGVLPCFDFAHQYSRTLGKWNTTEEFRKLLSEIEKKLGKKGLHNMHIHMEGIEFTERGEKNHVNLDECPFRYKDLLKVWKEFGLKGVVTCESPNLEQDALVLQKLYKSL
jgi:deoxyribonuclease-4